MSLIGRFLKIQRIQRRIVLRKFCKEIGYDPGNYSKIERGLLNPSLPMIATISKFYDPDYSKGEALLLDFMCDLTHISNAVETLKELSE